MVEIIDWIMSDVSLPLAPRYYKSFEMKMTDDEEQTGGIECWK